jgi:hypothetical protein
LLRGIPYPSTGSLVLFSTILLILMGSSPPTGVVTDITPLRGVVQTMLAVEADADGWRVGAYEGKPLWLVPNEVSGLTLMFPEDY